MRQRLLATSVFCGAAFALAAPAMAQDAQGAAPAASQEIVVTGSRISRQDYVADSPIVTVGQNQLQQAGSVTVETLLNQMPQFVPGATATANNPPNGGEAQVELRGLGVQRTLVLIDGRRMQPSNADNSVDLNTVPDALIDNIEVITGGASATYGSDAVAGVVNFKLKKHFTGLEFDAQYGKTDRNDGETQSYTVTLGSDFADHRGNAVLSLGYSQRDQIFNAARGFSAVSGASGTTPYGAWDADANQPSQAAINAVFAKYGAAANTALAGDRFGFNNDGTLFDQDTPGLNYRGNTTGTDFATIPTDGTYNTGALNLLVTPLTRYNMFARTNYDINSHVSAYAQFNFTHYSSSQELAPTPASGDPTVPGNTGFFVPVTNPFIPADLRTLLASRPDPNADFLIRSRTTSIGPRVDSFTYNVYQFLTGLKGDVANTDWTWDLYASFGRADQTEVQAGNVDRNKVNQLLRAADGGNSVCAGGFNPFGLNPVSAACQAFLSPLAHNVAGEEQREVQFSMQGGLYDLPAGRLKFAVGADYRRNAFDFSPDSLLASPTSADGGPGVAGFNFSPPESGATDVYELFGELYVPILRDLPFVKSLSVDLGYRFSDYGAGASDVGGVNTYKATADWSIAWGFSVRGGYERAIRAPNVGELFRPESQDFPAIGDPLDANNNPILSGDPCDVRGGYRNGPNAAQVRALCLAQGVPTALIDTYKETNNQAAGIITGNPDLKQETADTYSLGLVWAPRFSNPLFHRLSASVDYYNIKIKNAIAEIPGSVSVANCFNPAFNPTFSNANQFCQQISRSGNTGEMVLAEPLANVGAFETSGVDFQIDWGFGLGAVGWSDQAGSIALNLVGSYLDKFAIQDIPGEGFTNLTGTIGDNTVDNFAIAHPKWKFLTSLTYTYGPFDITARWQYIDAMADVTSLTTTGVQGTPSVNYFDLLAHWRINDTLELRLGVNNLTDKQPPTFASAANFQANTDPSTFDVYGRRYFVGLKARF